MSKTIEKEDLCHLVAIIDKGAPLCGQVLLFFRFQAEEVWMKLPL